MALRTIVLEGDEVLRKRSKEVKNVNDRLVELLDDMWETLRASNGLGLAAPQVGILKRVAIIDTSEEGEKVELINPEILEAVGVVTDEEACLSIPGIAGRIVRPEKVKIRAMNREGESSMLEAEGLLAKAICHEIDHLDGVLFIDKAIELRHIDDDYDDEEEESV